MKPVTTTVLIVRHAESVANFGNYFGSQSDSPLTERGRAQASALTDALASATVHAVYASDLSRAVDTVKGIAETRGLPLHTTPALRERHMGDLTGLSFDVAAEKYPEVWSRMLHRDPHVRPPGGESHADLAVRVAGFVDDAWLARHRGQTVVIGSHGGTIHHLLRRFSVIHDVDHPLSFSVHNASVSRVDIQDAPNGTLAPRLVYVNRTVDFIPFA